MIVLRSLKNPISATAVKKKKTINSKFLILNNTQVTGAPSFTYTFIVIVIIN